MNEITESIFNVNFDNINLFFKNMVNVETIIYNKNIEIYFKKINVHGTTGYYFIDDEKKYFLKIPFNRFGLENNYLSYDILKREIHLLKILNKYENNFPKLIHYNEYGIILEYIGDVINENNIPSDILLQIDKIINILKSENISHCDIKKEELLVKDNNLYIVDWGWATINNNWDCGIGLCDLEKPYLNKDSDLKCILKIISEYI
jgi:RIO-like serine/threonine protein kinase